MRGVYSQELRTMSRLERLMYRNERWMYADGHPNRLASALNRLWAWLAAAGLGPRRLVSLEVPGRRTSRRLAFPLVVADRDGERFLVAMLGERAGWVANVRAAGGQAVLRHGAREPVRLEEIEPARRAPILRRHLELAPAARSFVPVDRRAPIAEFERVAAGFPVFRIEPQEPAQRSRRRSPESSQGQRANTDEAIAPARRGRRWRRWIIGGIAGLIVLVVAAAAVDVSASGEPPLALPARDAGALGGPLDGTWTAGPGSVAGFRVTQTVLGLSGAVVGRTSRVTGRVQVTGDRVTGDRVTTATFAVDLTSLVAKGKPSPQFELSLDTADFPLATIALAGPLRLDAAFASGTTITTTAIAELTMHGTSRPVTVTLTARREGAFIDVVGSASVTFADWGIKGPAGYGLLGSLADRGEAEFLLVLRRG